LNFQVFLILAGRDLVFHRIGLSILRRNGFAAALAVLATWPVAAQTQKSSIEQWRSLAVRAFAAQKAGDHALDAKLNEEALRLARNAFGDRAQQTLITVYNLATAYYDEKRYSEAEPLYREALQGMREVLGARHQYTLMSVISLAILYKDQGRYGEAEPLYREALQARREMLGARHPDTLESLNGLASLYLEQSRYDEAEPLYREALQARREVLGTRHPSTLNSLNNLAVLYQSQGRYSEAEPLSREVLQARREVLGARHPDTLGSLNNLANLFHRQGRYGEAEPLYREALQAKREVLGDRHPDTLASLNNLASLYQSQGRYGEAEPLYREALQAKRDLLGARHPDTLMSLHNLGSLYQDQRRYDEAEHLYREALQAMREVLGPRHADTLTSLSDLAGLYRDQGRYGDAEPLYREALQARRAVLGPRHPATLGSLNNLANLYSNQGRDGEAEPLYREALQAKREVLGVHHPDTLRSLNNLAVFYLDHGRYGEAEPLFQEALQLSREVRGPRHPETLTYQRNMVQNLVNQDRRVEAVRLLEQMEADVLGWIGQELYSTEAGATRRGLVSSQATFQDDVLTLATTAGSIREARRLAATVMLRFKALQGEEEAYLARLSRRSQDPRVQTLVREISRLRAALAAAAKEAPDTFEKTLQALESKRQELISISPEYQSRLQAQTATMDDVRRALPAGSVLIEFRQFWPYDFRTSTAGDPRVAGLLLTSAGEPVVADLGPIWELHPLTVDLGASASGRGVAPDPQGQPLTPADEAAAKLYERLFAPFKDAVAAAKTIYVAPDGILNLVPFARLKLTDGRYWFEQQEVHLLQTGRDLLRPGANRPARGLLALGGIDYDAGAAGAGPQDSVFLAAAGSDRKTAVSRAAESFRKGFGPLPATASEVQEVTSWFQARYGDEPAETWSGADASKARLMALKSPPRVLHLATHGFYLPNQSREPMLLSGIALAGANREVAGAGNEGLLFALEAEGLNLDGTELVVLSACDTAQGDVDYSEGVFGLARALRTAGARYVLVTLWKLDDFMARDFMVDFYKNWIGQEHSDPARALHDTQRQWIAQDGRRNPKDWAPYVLIE
jgi:CHAT domain-containing protein/tetratricopeptide (TPR) repeat protein